MKIIFRFCWCWGEGKFSAVCCQGTGSAINTMEQFINITERVTIIIIRVGKVRSGEGGLWRTSCWTSAQRSWTLILGSSV